MICKYDSELTSSAFQKLETFICGEHNITQMGH